ncbi:hypothetical protein SDC9_42383 [bioreactor metagenome]|uniref:Uncharacterized protein n=1 Tax=bioreactor metagenome TaxID=1076179 RepID=A0A644VXW5_9ZZZZ
MDRGDDDEGGQDVGQHVPQDDGERREADEPGGVHVFLFLLHQHGAPDRPGVEHPAHDGEGGHQLSEAPAEGGHDEEGHQHGREGELDVHHPHEEAVEPAAEVARHEAEKGAENAGEDHHRQADEQGDPAAVDHGAQQVPPLVVRAEDKGRVPALHPDRGFEGVHEVQAADVVGVLGGEQGPRGHKDHEKRDDEEPCQGTGAPDEIVKELAFEKSFFFCAHSGHLRSIRGSIRV